ncbi:MAG: hypothetical protein LRZ84_05665 [Desertifilum sp.]|nr:hypothetical protein [Desertifilum sp.]
MSKQQAILTIKFLLPVAIDFLFPGVGLGIGALIYLYDLTTLNPPHPPRKLMYARRGNRS